MGLIVPNKTCKIPKQVFVWITYILDVCVYRFLYHIVLDLLYFSARAHKAEWKQLNSIFVPVLPKLVTFKMLFDSFLPGVLNVKSVAGWEPAAMSTHYLCGLSQISSHI